MFSRTFWKDTAERVVASAAGGVTTVFGGDAFNAWEADWKAIGIGALGTALFSLLKCLAALKVPSSVSPASVA